MMFKENKEWVVSSQKKIKEMVEEGKNNFYDKKYWCNTKIS